MRKKTCKSAMKRASQLAFGCLATGASLLFGLADSASAQVSTGKFSYALQPNGTWNRIEMFHNPGLTYDGAVAAAQGMGGYLFTPRSSTENGAGAGLNGEAWIGLDDVATEGQWKLVDNGDTIWTGLGSGAGGGPVSGQYHNWNGAGEPNDAGGEDAAVILNTGRWNDLPNANPAVTRNFIVEFPTGATSQPDPAPGLAQAAVGKWNVRRINGTPDMQHVAAVEMAMYSGIGSTTDYQTSTINFRDQNSGDGYLGGGVLFPGDDAGNADENFFSIYARGRIRITEEADYTFGFSGDDGAELQIHGQNFISSTNFGDGANSNLVRSNIGGFAAHEGDRIAYPNPTGNGAVMGVVHLTPGDYDLTYKWFENGGGAHAEVFAAKGAHTSMNSNFRIIGDALPQTISPPTLTAPLATALAQIPELGGDPSAPAVAGWDVGRKNGPNNLGAAIAAMQPVIDDPLTNPPDFYEVHPTVSFSDDVEGGGNIGFPQVVFPGNVVGAGENDFAIAAVTDMTVTQAGLYRFTVFGDDGSRFRVNGTSGWTAGGIATTDPGQGSPSDGFIIPGCCSDGYGEVALTPGTYRVELIWNEIGGGAYVGVRYSIDGQGNFLLGSFDDNSNAVAPLQLVPEPSSIVLVGMGLVGAVVGLRRRRRS